jgi:hypothetical protein
MEYSVIDAKDVRQFEIKLDKYWEHTPVFSGVRVARSLVVCVVFCRLLFILFLLG